MENQKPSDNSGLKFLEDNSEVTEITDELLDALLEKIVVYADKTIELRWKFSNRSNEGSKSVSSFGRLFVKS